MDSQQHAAIRRMFYAYRCQPSEPDHALIIKSELASLKVLDKGDYKNFKDFYDRTAKENEVKVKTASEVASEAVADGVVTMEELHAIAAAKNANPLPLPEDADGEVEEKKREGVLEGREEIKPEKIDTPLGEPAIEDIEEEPVEVKEVKKPKKKLPTKEELEELGKTVAKRKAAKKKKTK